ncbi:MAG: DUF2971 domain-containing protein [Flavobacteriaceae bacterium]|jgi:hypothetical protein|nr:DUF2971 domain-containing protein [Flavobacteriaceae bacterium]
MNQILYKYRSLEDFRYFLDIILNNRLHAAKYPKLNDPMEGIFYSLGLEKDILEEIAKDKMKYKICSLSRKKNDELMWSHYANGHKGVVLGININTSKYYDIMCVKYDGLAFIEEQDIHCQTAREILRHKLEDWKYEEEIRVLVSKQNYVKVGIKEIIFGRRTSSFDKKLIKNLIKKLNLDIQLIEADDIMKN